MNKYLGEDNYNNSSNSNYNTNYYSNNNDSKKLFYGYNTKNIGNNNSDNNNNGLYYSIDFRNESNNIIEYNIINNNGSSCDVSNNNSYGYKDFNNFNNSIKENDINKMVYGTVDIVNYQNIENGGNTKYKRIKNNKFKGKNKENLDNKNNIHRTNVINDIEKVQSTSSFEVGDDNEDEFQSDINQAEILQNGDHNELITPTYISMFFNATSMIPLKNVDKMIKDEPIETINESYDTCNTNDTNDTKYNSTKCIPIIDLYSLASDSP